MPRHPLTGKAGLRLEGPTGAAKVMLDAEERRHHPPDGDRGKPRPGSWSWGTPSRRGRPSAAWSRAQLPCRRGTPTSAVRSAQMSEATVGLWRRSDEAAGGKAELSPGGIGSTRSPDADTSSLAAGPASRGPLPDPSDVAELDPRETGGLSHVPGAQVL